MKTPIPSLMKGSQVGFRSTGYKAVVDTAQRLKQARGRRPNAYGLMHSLTSRVGLPHVCKMVLLAGAFMLMLAPAPVLAQATCDGQPAGIVGDSANNTLPGTPQADVIAGLGGNDTINGRGDDDAICGNAGRDRLRGNAGNDDAFGGGGPDLVIGDGGDDGLRGEGGNDRLDGVDGELGNDVLDGGAGTDTCRIDIENCPKCPPSLLKRDSNRSCEEVIAVEVN